MKISKRKILSFTLLVLVIVSGLAITQTVFAALPCTGEYTSCDIDYGGVKKGICLAGLCGSTDISLNLKSKYDATKKYCADSATKNECITPTVKPEVNGNGDLIGFSCAAKAVNTACTVSTCAQNPAGVPFSGCTNAAEKCQFYAGSAYYPSYPSCVANTACPDADKDGIPLCWAPGQYTKWDTPVPPPKKDPSRFSDDSGIGDCDDKDPYSYGYSSANISSVSFAKINKNYPLGNFSPLDGVSLTVNFKRKCGHTTPTPPAVPLYVSLVFSPTSEFTLSGSSPINFVRKSDFVYTADIGFNSYLTEELIAAIVKNPKPKLKFMGADEFTRVDKPFNDPTLPMTNCAQTYGNGKNKVVYMRDNTGLYGQTLSWSNLAISGFTSIEPLKKYQTEFTHFVDLKKHNTNFKDVFAPFSDLRWLRDNSSCGKWNSMYFGMYLNMEGTSPDASGQTLTWGPSGIAIIMPAGFDKNLSYTFVHEFGHAFANLSDEYSASYYESLYGSDIEKIKSDLIPHCSFEPAEDYSSKGVLYGGKSYEGCSLFARTDRFPKRPIIFRPSAQSIMNDHRREQRFNVISCAYLIQAIKHSPSWKGELAECVEMTKTSPPGVIPVGQ